MDPLYESLEGVAHVRTSDGFVQVMKLSSSDEDDGYDDDEFDSDSDYEDAYEISEGLRPLPALPEENYNVYCQETLLVNLDELYAKVDKTQTRLGKSKKKREQLEMEAVVFRVKVSTYLESEESRAKFFKALRVYHESKDVKKLVKNLKRALNTDKTHPLFKEIKPLLTPEHVPVYEKLTEPNKNGERLIKVSRKRGEESIGFSFRGGREFGLGFFITAVANNSPAHNAGLKPGDEIRKINGLPLLETLHEEFLSILKLNTSVTLLVKNVGRIPCISEDDDIIWNKIDEEEFNGRIGGTEQQDLSKTDRLISFTVGKEGIGCVIQKGVENHDGIFIISLTGHSLAEEVNLMVGDQILDVNGKSFRNISHKQAVECLKGKNRLTMIVRYNDDVYQLLTGPKEIKPILVTEPKTEEQRKEKKTTFASSKHYDIIEYEEEEEEYNEEENEVAVVPSASNFDYPPEVLKGREVHYVAVPKVASLDIDLLRRNDYISVIAVHGGGAVQRHGFIQPGDWILNVEGDDLIGVQLKVAKEIINNAMKRWSTYIEFIIACLPGRKPINLPTKEETGKILKDPQFTLKSSVNNQSFSEKFDGIKGAVNIFEGNPIIKKDIPKRKDSLALKTPSKSQLEESGQKSHSANFTSNNSNATSSYGSGNISHSSNYNSNSSTVASKFGNNKYNSSMSNSQRPTSRPPPKSISTTPQNSTNTNAESHDKDDIVTDSTPYSNVRAVKINVEKAKAPAPPPPSKQQSPPQLAKGKSNLSSNLKKDEPEEEHFSIKEMIRLRNGVSKEAILKEREKNEKKAKVIEKKVDFVDVSRVEESPRIEDPQAKEDSSGKQTETVTDSSLSISNKIQMFKQPNENTSNELDRKPILGKISKSVFETKSSVPSHMNVTKKRSDSNTSSNHPFSNSRSSSFASDAGSENKNQTTRSKAPLRPNHNEVLKDLDESLDALDSGRSNSSIASSTSSVNFTLDLSASMLDDSVDSIYSTSAHENGEKIDENDISKRSSLPPPNTVSSVRSLFQNESSPNKRQGSPHKSQGSPHKSQGSPHKSQGSPNKIQGSPHKNQGSPHKSPGNKGHESPIKSQDSPKKLVTNIDEIPKENTVSSARSLFQKKTNDDSSVSFKHSPAKLSSRFENDSNINQENETITKPPRLTSPNLFFEPQREVPDEEKRYSTGEDELNSARNPKDIWEASQEEFTKKDETEESESNDAATRTHMLLMKQSNMGELPAQVQMAQILGDKNEDMEHPIKSGIFTPKVDTSPRSKDNSTPTALDRAKIFENKETDSTPFYDVHSLKKTTQKTERVVKEPEDKLFSVQLKGTPKNKFNPRKSNPADQKLFNVQLKETTKSAKKEEDSPLADFQGFEFKRTVSEPIKRAPELTRNEVHDFKFKRTVSDVPKKPEQSPTSEATLENNLKPSQMNISRGSYKQPQEQPTKRQSDQIRDFIKGIDFSSNEPANLKPETKPAQPVASEYKPINVSELRTPFQSKSKEDVLVLEKGKASGNIKPNFVKQEPVDIKTVINQTPPPLDIDTLDLPSDPQTKLSPSGREIKSILSKSKKTNPKKVQFSNFVDVGVAASPATTTQKQNGHVAPPPPPLPPPVEAKEESSTTKVTVSKSPADIGGIVAQINQSSDIFTKNYTSDLIPGTKAKETSPRKSRESLIQAKKRFNDSSKELTSKLNLGNDEQPSYESTRPKGLSWFSDRPDQNDGKGKKQNGFNSIPAF